MREGRRVLKTVGERDELEVRVRSGGGTGDGVWRECADSESRRFLPDGGPSGDYADVVTNGSGTVTELRGIMRRSGKNWARGWGPRPGGSTALLYTGLARIRRLQRMPIV